jgi:hypothetical protein
MPIMDNEAELKKRQDFLRELYVSGYDKASAFMVLVITAGYAGAFTLWDHVERYISYPERMVIACLFALSLMIFVGWQVRGQWKLSQQQLAISKIVTAPLADFPALLDQFRVDQAKLRASLHKQLPVVFAATVSLEGLGAAVLVFVCLKHFITGPP